MRKKFTYTLDKSSKKFQCPDCGHRTFVRYIDEDKEYHTDESYGRCDREHNCGCLNIPTDEAPLSIKDFEPKKLFDDKPSSFIPYDHVKPTWRNYKHNPFTLWLVEKFGDAKTVELIKKYRWGVDGTSVYTMDYTVFWQIDINDRVRSGKIIKYLTDGHRDKESMTTWYHRKQDGGKMIFTDFNLKQCLFGEHLLRYEPRKPVAIVESEKTAIVASIFIPKYLWLACGGKGELNRSKADVVKNRSVTLFPDLGALDDWKEKAKEYGFSISSRIEDIASEDDRRKGLDIADFLIR